MRVERRVEVEAKGRGLRLELQVIVGLMVRDHLYWSFCMWISASKGTRFYSMYKCHG